MSQNSFQTINLNSNIVLSWATSFDSGPVLRDINNVNPDANNRTITLPDATLANLGTSAVFNNISDKSFSILTNEGLSVVADLESGDVVNIYLISNIFANGEWSVTPYGGGATSITTFTAESAGNTISITNGTISSPGGTINFELPASIANLNLADSAGFAVLTNVEDGAWSTRTLTAGTNIEINDGDGTESDPVINLVSTVENLTSLEVGNFFFTESTLNPVNANSSLTINSDGTGLLDLNGITIDTESNIIIPGNIEVTGVFNNNLTPKAYCLFTDTLLGTSNIIILIDQVGIESITGSRGNYTCNFATPRANTNYSVVINVATDGTDLPPVYNGSLVFSSKTINSFSVVITDGSGEKVDQIPTGVTILVLSST